MREYRLTRSLEFPLIQHVAPLSHLMRMAMRFAGIDLWMWSLSLKETELVLATLRSCTESESNGAGPVSAEWMIPKALWLARNEPELFHSAKRICEYQDYQFSFDWSHGCVNQQCLGAMALSRRCWRLWKHARSITRYSRSLPINGHKRLLRLARQSGRSLRKPRHCGLQANSRRSGRCRCVYCDDWSGRCQAGGACVHHGLITFASWSLADTFSRQRDLGDYRGCL